MLKIDRQTQSFIVLDTPKLADVSITERYHLQEFIANSPGAFFSEIGQELFLLGEEILLEMAVKKGASAAAKKGASEGGVTRGCREVLVSILEAYKTALGGNQGAQDGRFRTHSADGIG